MTVGSTREQRLAGILVTGAAGFIGSTLCRRLLRLGHSVVGTTRAGAPSIAGVSWRQVGNIGAQTDWSAYLDGIDIVVHLAGRAHRPASSAVGLVETRAAAALARTASICGVSRLVHISSIRAMGAATRRGRPFCHSDLPAPADRYGRTKLATEYAVASAARESGLDLVILRPPLVYGPGAKGNFRSLIALASSGMPLPFAALDNRRSLIFIENLVDLLVLACTHPEAPGRVLLARDDPDLSTPDLLRALAGAVGHRARLFPVPALLLAGLRLAPVLRPALSRLTLSLQVDDAETRRILGWTPAVPSETALAATVRAWRQDVGGEPIAARDIR